MSLLLRLLWLSLRGRAIRAGRQLRQPKYLAGAIIGVGWLLLWIGQWLVSADVRAFLFSSVQARLAGDAGEVFRLAAAAVLTAALSMGWFVPLGRLALPLKESELHLLLPAPLSRRRIVQYALLKGQIPVLLTAGIFGVMLSNGRPAGWIRAAGALWLLLTVWELHNKMRALFFLRLRELPPRAAWTRRLAVLAPLAAAWALLAPRVLALADHVREVALTVAASHEAGLDELLAGLGSFRMDAVGRTLLAPARWLIEPAFAESPARFAAAVVPGLVLLVAAHEAVVRSRARFEEPALAHAQREADRKSPGRKFRRISLRGRRSSPFRLTPTGRPATAVLWKNLMQVSRFRLARAPAAGILAATVLAVLPAVARVPEAFFGFLVLSGLWFLVFSPLLVPIGRRNDLRGDLGHVELVRTWPIDGRSLMLAESLSSGIVAWLFSLMGAGLVAAGFYGSRLRAAVFDLPPGIMIVPAEALGQSPELVLALALVALLAVAAGVAALVCTLQNLLALLFPAWVGLGPAAARGMGAMGHQLLIATAMGLALLVGSIPSLLLVGLALLAQAIAGVPWSVLALPLWGVLFCLPLLAEAALIARSAGRLWNGLDPSGEILESRR